MELASDILDVNQIKNELDLLNHKLEEETVLRRTIASNVIELLRQQLSSEFESSEIDKLLMGTIKSKEIVQKSSLVTINETIQSMVEFSNKCEKVLNDYALLKRAESTMEANSLHRFQDLPNILGEEAIINITTEMDQKLSNMSATFEKEVIKLTRINDDYVQLKKDRKILTKNVSNLTTSIKKLTFKRDLKKKLKISGFK